MKKSVKVGQAFDLHVDVVETQSALQDSKTRSVLAIVSVIYVIVAVTVLFIVGIVAHSFSLILSFWTVVGPFVGAIIGYYFGRKNE